MCFCLLSFFCLGFGCCLAQKHKSAFAFGFLKYLYLLSTPQWLHQVLSQKNEWERYHFHFCADIPLPLGEEWNLKVSWKNKNLTVFEAWLRLLGGNVLPINPKSTEILFSKLHDGVKPVPKSEASVRKWLLTKLRPWHHCRREIVIVAMASECKWRLIKRTIILMDYWVPKCFASQIAQIIFTQTPAARGSKLDIKRLGQLAPRHFIWHQKWLSTPFSKCIVP